MTDELQRSKQRLCLLCCAAKAACQPPKTHAPVFLKTTSSGLVRNIGRMCELDGQQSAS